MKIINGFIILSLLITACYFLGLAQFFLDFQVDQCEMTYMFEYPQFVKILTKLDEKYPKYELTAYSEGRFTQNARNMDFTGVPVLFVPGNAGSHQQVRSLSSIALRKALNSRTPFHFDYFTVNLNNEYSALSGVVLNDQLEYVNGSIYRILQLYKGKFKPESVVLVGHSMGAIIAQKITSSLPQDSKLIPIVISLAGPLKRVPLILDYQMEKFYQSINNTIPKDTTFVSITGGFSDFLISPVVANDNRIRVIQAVTTNIPKSWVESNHVQILWCKQTVLAINRALFDSVDLRTKQITSDSKYRKKVFQHHLIKNSGTKLNGLMNINVSNQGKWTEILDKQVTVSLLNGVKQQEWFLIPILDHHILNVLAVNLEVSDWIFMCRKNCTNAVNLSEKSEISPSIRYKRRTANFNLDELIVENPDSTHILIRVLPTDEPVVLNIDLHPTNDKKRRMPIKLPKFWQFKGTTILQKTVKNSLSYVLEFSELNHVWQSYNLWVKPIKCTGNEHHAVAQVVSSWANNNIQQFFTETKKDALNLRLHTSKPQNYEKNAENAVFVKLTLDPTCEYTVTLKIHYLGILGQLARHYSSLLIVNVAVVTLMTLRTQLSSFDGDSFPLFFTAMCQGLRPYYLLTAVKLLTALLSTPIWPQKFPKPDTYLLREENIDFLILPLITYLTSIGIVWLLTIGFSISLIITESSVNRLTLKFLGKIVKFPTTWTEYLMSALHKLPFAVAALLILLSMSGCGALALTLGSIFYFLKLTQMSQDLIEDALFHFVKNFFRKTPVVPQRRTFTGHNALFFHSSVFFLWFLITVLNLPIVLIWAHNFKYKSVMSPDPSFVPGLALSFCAFPLWQMDLPKKKKWNKEISQLIVGIATIALVFAPISLYRLNYLLTLVMIIITLQQVFAPDLEPETKDENEDKDTNLEEKYERVKTKLE